MFHRIKLLRLRVLIVIILRLLDRVRPHTLGGIHLIDPKSQNLLVATDLSFDRRAMRTFR